MGETDPRVEIVARAMCEAGDLDPDERMANDGPRWRYYVPHASYILAALDAARPVEPLQEYDATDAIDRAIANWSTISDEPPADESEVARLTAEIDAVGYQYAHDIEALKARATAAEAEVADLRAGLAQAVEALEALITAAILLAQNAEGCAVNHYGEDFALHGEPGWLRDCRKDITIARTALASIKEPRT